MPKVEIPMRKVAQVKGLAKDGEFLAEAKELIKLVEDVKKKSDRIAELRLSVYEKMVRSLGENEKSVQMGTHRMTAYQGEPSNKLDKKKLLKYITADKLQRCYTKGDPPRPTVQVAKMESDEAKVTRELRRGLDE